MKKTATQLLAVLLSLALTVTLVSVMAVSTSAATSSAPVGSNGDIQGDTNHCEEFESTYPSDPYPYTLEVIPKLVLSQPGLEYPAMPEYSMTLFDDTDGLKYYVDLSLKKSDVAYECNVALYSAIFPANAPEYCKDGDLAFYVNEDTEVTFIYDAIKDTLNMYCFPSVTPTDAKYTLPYTEQPTTCELTSEPIGPTLELYCILEIHRPDGVVMESGMYQAVMGFSPTFTADISDLPVFDTPYKATLNVYSCIWPDQLVFSSDEWFYVRSEGAVTFTAYAPSATLDISGKGIELTADPDVTYPVTYPTSIPPYTTVPDVTTLPQVWTTAPDVTYPTTLPEVWTSSPVEETTEEPTSAPALNEIKYGDVNMDGKITIDDVTMIQRAAAEIVKFTNSLQKSLADINNDGVVSVTDVTCLQKYLAEYTEGTGRAGLVAVSVDYD